MASVCHAASYSCDGALIVGMTSGDGWTSSRMTWPPQQRPSQRGTTRRMGRGPSHQVAPNTADTAVTAVPAEVWVSRIHEQPGSQPRLSALSVSLGVLRTIVPWDPSGTHQHLYHLVTMRMTRCHGEPQRRSYGGRKPVAGRPQRSVHTSIDNLTQLELSDMDCTCVWHFTCFCIPQKASRPGMPALNLAWNRALGHFICSLIGNNRILFTNMRQRPEAAN